MTGAGDQANQDKRQASATHTPWSARVHQRGGRTGWIRTNTTYTSSLGDLAHGLCARAGGPRSGVVGFVCGQGIGGIGLAVSRRGRTCSEEWSDGAKRRALPAGRSGWKILHCVGSGTLASWKLGRAGIQMNGIGGEQRGSTNRTGRGGGHSRQTVRERKGEGG